MMKSCCNYGQALRYHGRFLRSALAFWLLLLLGPVAAQTPQSSVNIVYSEVQGCLYMLEGLAGSPHRFPDMGNNFRGRVSNWRPIQEAAERWKVFKTGPEWAATWHKVKDDGRELTLDERLEVLAVESVSYRDFTNQAWELLGPKGGQLLIDCLRALRPAYHRYWWTSDQLEHQKEILNSELERGEIKETLAAMAAFYAAPSVLDVTPTVVLVPYHMNPGQSGGSLSGQNLGRIQIMEINLEKPIPLQSGPVVHELAHWISRNAPARRQIWSDFFRKRGALGRAALAQLEEGLATAIGNGWYEDKLDPNRSKDDHWYGDEVIDAYGKALAPIVATPLNEKRPPNEAELALMVGAFEKAVPDALARFDVVGASVVVVTDRREVGLPSFVQGVRSLGAPRRMDIKKWTDEDLGPASFIVYWLSGDDRSPLAGRGWQPADLEGWQQYRLHFNPDLGWELAFDGSAGELLALLRELAKHRLEESSR